MTADTTTWSDVVEEAAEFAERYRDSTVLTGPAFPPPRLQPLLLGPLARLHRWRVKRAAR